MSRWTEEGYWNAVLGGDRSAATVITEFDLDPTDRPGLGEWLGHAEAESWRVGGQGDELPAEWAEYHTRALDSLCEVQVKEREHGLDKAHNPALVAGSDVRLGGEA